VRRYHRHFLPPSRALWRPKLRLCGDLRPPAEFASWLFDATSLTARLQMRYPKNLRLEVLGQNWERATINEARQLAIGPKQLCLERRIVFKVAEEAVVVARTMMPRTSLQGRLRRLTQLGTRPLGAALFADPSTRRIQLEVAWIPPAHPLFPDLQYPAWGRRSLFRIADKPILVYEVFLPQLLKRRATGSLATRAAA
jgi:chorismate--pyruvate lyase